MCCYDVSVMLTHHIFKLSDMWEVQLKTNIFLIISKILARLNRWAKVGTGLLSKLCAGGRGGG